jgi:hypothetical protein
MVTREELDKSLNLKILLKGASGSGKSFTCAKIAGYVASQGWNVLYMDGEKGAVKELRKLEDNVLVNIDRVRFDNYEDLVNNIEFKKKEKGDRLKLIIIDPMHLLEVARLSAKDAFYQQGYYYVGEKKVEITNKKTFDLRGYMYQVPNTWVLEFLTDLANAEQDIIATVMTPNKYDEKSPYDGKFDYVFELYYDKDRTEFTATPLKLRGAEANSKPVKNIWSALIDNFKVMYEKK